MKSELIIPVRLYRTLGPVQFSGTSRTVLEALRMSEHSMKDHTKRVRSSPKMRDVGAPYKDS